MLNFAAAAYLLCAGLSVLLAVFLWQRRSSGASLALMALCLFCGIWNLGYGGALLTQSRNWWIFWGQVQYLGVSGLAACTLLFTLLWTDRGRLLNFWLLGMPIIEGVGVLIIVINPSTQGLIRKAPDHFGPKPWKAVTGPLYWPHFLYVLCLLLLAMLIFLVNLWQRSRLYRRVAVVLSAAIVFPFVANILFNLNLTSVDLTPNGFTVALAILTWAVVREGLVRLAPVAHSQVVAGLTDAVFVLDLYGHVVDINPAAQRLAVDLRTTRGLVRRRLPQVLAPIAAKPGSHQLRLRGESGLKSLEVQVNELPAEPGHESGRIVVVRDITERQREQEQRTRILAEQARVAETLSLSLRPDALPVVEGISFAAQYHPAHETALGGDFYDVYRCDGLWAFSLGDVSGKGASAAAVTALARYTLRALSTSGQSALPAVKSLNRQILATDDQEKYLTVVHGRCRAVTGGDVHVDFVLGGHPPPVLVPADGRAAEPVGEPGTAVGLLATVDLHETHVVLHPGDALVLYTDGVLEARQGRSFFGEERLLEHLDTLRGVTAREMASSLMQCTLEFQAGHANDDIAILVIQAADPYATAVQI